MQTYRAATLNVWSRFGPWEQRLPVLRQELERIAVDVIGLQEVLCLDDFDQAKIIGAGILPHAVWGQASENYGVPTGNAILSRFPVLRHEVIVLPDNGDDERRSMLFAELATPFGKLPCFCTHLQWRLDQGHVRERQVRALAGAIAELAPEDGLPALLLGDFNAEPDSDEIRFLRGLTSLGGESVYFADTFGDVGEKPGHTFSRRNPFAAQLHEPERRIDYVFVRGLDPAGRGRPLDARLCFDAAADGVFPSDHFGVVVTLTAGR